MLRKGPGNSKDLNSKDIRHTQDILSEHSAVKSSQQHLVNSSLRSPNQRSAKYNSARAEHNQQSVQHTSSTGKPHQQIGQHSPNSENLHQQIGQHSPNSENLHQQSGQHSPNSENLHQQSGQHSPNSENLHQQSGQYSPNSGKPHQQIGQHSPNSENLHQQSGHYRPNTGNPHQQSGQYSPNSENPHQQSGHYRPNTGNPHQQSVGHNSNLEKPHQQLRQHSPNTEKHKQQSGQYSSNTKKTHTNLWKNSPKSGIPNQRTVHHRSGTKTHLHRQSTQPIKGWKKPAPQRKGLWHAKGKKKKGRKTKQNLIKLCPVQKGSHLKKFRNLLKDFKICKRISLRKKKKGRKTKQNLIKLCPVQKGSHLKKFRNLLKDFKICKRISLRKYPSYKGVIPCDKIGLGNFSAKNMTQEESIPIRSLEELEEWTPIPGDLRIASVPLAKMKKKDASTPQTLLCHDMCGGYLQDRFVNGCKEADAYRFYHWQYIDMFVYFSHHFITVPPVTLTNAAHTHGVMMLGTFITEWDDGKKRCNKFLESDESYKALADKLVLISHHYKFEGWLVNIENVIQENQVQRLCDFVAYLTQEMHKKIPGSKVIWYDSVIKTGKLSWQNALNQQNSMFFDVSDGIFLNYNWNDKKLQQSRTMAEEKERAMDVFVGIDVFGRGCLGGGGWNTVEALSAVRRFNMSAAIFAPGWVYETQGKEKYTSNENLFWSKLDHLLPNCEYCEPYLCTSFCQGFGWKDYLNGMVIKDEPWHNLTRQQLQPSYTNTQFGRRDLIYEPSMSVWSSDAYNGGTCLTIEGKLPPTGMPLIFRLFDTCIADIDEPVMVSYTFKSYPKTTCDIFLELETLSGNVQGSFILRRDSHPTGSPNSKVLINLSADEIKEKLGSGAQDLTSPQNDWTTRYYYLDAESIRNTQIKLVSVGLQAINVHDKQSMKLGQIQIVPLSLLDRSRMTCIKEKAVPTTTSLQVTHQETS